MISPQKKLKSRQKRVKNGKKVKISKIGIWLTFKGHVKRSEVTLERQNTPAKTEALRNLCECINARHTLYPGTNLQLHFDVEKL